MKPKLTKCYRLDPEPDLDQLHEHMVRCGESAFAVFGRAPFLWSLALPGGLVLDIETPWEGEKEKRLQTGIICLLLKVFECQRYAFMSEVWVAVRSAAPGEKIDTDTPPSEDPNAEDVLMVVSSDASHRSRMTRWAVKYSTQRPEFGKLLARDDGHDGNDFSGRMFDLYRRTDGIPDKIVRTSREAVVELKKMAARSNGTDFDIYEATVGVLSGLCYIAERTGRIRP